MALGGQAEALRAALRYLLAALLGSMAYLLGVALIYGQFGTLSLAEVAHQVRLMGQAELMRPALVLMLVGLALKTALFPLHGWLPPAHGIAKSTGQCSAVSTGGQGIVLYCSTDLAGNRGGCRQANGWLS